MTSRRPLLVVLSLLFPVAIVLFAACSDQAEGERCDTRNTRNGSDDCQPGLTCVPGSDLGSSGSQYCVDVITCGVCCPVDRATADVDICRLSTSLPGGGNGVPDAGDAGDSATSDASPGDSGDDAADSSTDASDAASSDASDAAFSSDASDATTDGPG